MSRRTGFFRPFILGLVVGATGLAAFQLAVDVRDLSETRVALGPDEAASPEPTPGTVGDPDSFLRMAQETQGLQLLLKSQLDGATRDEVVTLLDRIGLTWTETGEGDMILATNGSARIGFVFADGRLLDLTGECDTLGMPDSCQPDGEQ